MLLAKEKGFGVSPEQVNTMEKIALIHSELSEALAAYRNKKMNGQDGFAEELADAVIRILHLAAVHGLNLGKEILEKLELMKQREYNWQKMNEGHV
jgi:NTP pyrophosphatase (non-canonical NTP hydrolase)